MTQQVINIGASPNDTSGDPIRTAFTKVNANFTDLYTQISGLEFDAVIPNQTGNSGKYLTTSGSALSWSNVSQLTNSTYSLTLGSDGTLNLPQAPSAGAAVIQPSSTTYGIKLVANGNIWTLGTNGSLTFPDTSVQTTAWTGVLPSPTYSGSSSIGNVTPAALNLNNTGSAGQVETQLTLINTAGNANTGSAIDFFTYTGAGNGVPGARIQSVDDGNFSSNFSIVLKATGNNGNGSLSTQWTFGSDGRLTFPDNSVQTTAYLGTATTSQIGGVQPDGTSITISNGVISSASSFQPNGVFNITTTGGTTVLTSSTAINITLTGSNTQTIQLPDATTLKAGWIYRINNNSSSASSITVNNASGGQVGTVPQGGDTQFILLDNSTTNGTWDTHGWIPSNLLMGSSIFQLGSSAYTIAPYNSSLTIGTATGGTTYNFATGATTSGNTKTVNIGTGGVSGSITAITVGSASGTSTTAFNGVTTFNAAVKLNGVTTTGIVATAQTAGTIASAATIAPTNPITFISGNTQITTITPPSGIATYGGQITLIPTGLWTTATSGNIALATTAVVSRALIMTYDAGTNKWYPSY
jgi:hypothetical protein